MKTKIIRYIFGFIILTVILASITFSKKALFIVSSVFIYFAIKEYRKMFLEKEINVHLFIPEIIAISCAYIFIYGLHKFITPVLLFGVFISFVATIIKNKNKKYILTTFSTIAAFMLVLCTLYIVKLFYMFPPYNIKFVLIFIFAVMAGDFSASKIGPYFKNRLHVEISPNKTLAGAISNLCFTCVVSLLLIPVLNFNFFQVLIFGMVVSICAQIGDLSISMLKRDLGIKHSGSFFYEYGGILDRVDAFIFSAPAAYYTIILIMALQNKNINAVDFYTFLNTFGF